MEKNYEHHNNKARCCVGCSVEYIKHDRRHNSKMAHLAIEESSVQDGNNEFYSRDSNNEAERLSTMAEYADPISINSLKNYLKTGSVIVDIGAGDSISLGDSFRNMGYKYIAVDQRTGAVEKHREAGFEAIQSSALDIDMPEKISDAVHSRFTLSWLSSEQRLMALNEMARISKNGGKIVIIDYDWSSIEGPDALKQASSVAMDILENAGFDPNYGKKIAKDIMLKSDFILENSKKQISVVKDDVIPVYEGTLEECLPIFEQTATSILDYLCELGDLDSQNKLKKSLNDLKSYSRIHPNEFAKLANVNSVVFEFKDIYSSDDLTLISTRQDDNVEKRGDSTEYIEGVDYYKLFPESNENMKNTVKVCSDKMINAVRRMQGESYVHHGLVLKGALNSDGTLSETIDPIDQVRRSEYVATIDQEDSSILSCIRLINTGGEKNLSVLPTVQQIGADHLEAYNISDENSEKVMEVSALSSDIKKGSTASVIKTIIGLMVYSKEQGYEGAIMELRKDKIGVFQSLFGKSNLIAIKDENLENFPIKIDGVSQSTKYSCLVANPQTFCHAAREYAFEKLKDANADGRKKSLSLDMIYESLKNED